MFKLYALLCYEFLKTGVFAIGGGYAALPFLYYMQEKYNWFSIDELTNMIAVSNITPGPIGINMATYTGYTTAGFLGSVIATFSIVLIPFILMVLMIKLLNKYKTCPQIQAIFVGLRPASCALLASIGLKLLYQTVKILSEYSIDFQALLLFIILIIPFSFFKKNPLLTILFGALGGIIFKNFI